MKEILKHLVETTTLPEDSYLDQDAEILEIFVEEIEEIFVDLDPLFEKWYAEPTHQETLLSIRRHFHTLKALVVWWGQSQQVKQHGRLKIP